MIFFAVFEIFFIFCVISGLKCGHKAVIVGVAVTCRHELAVPAGMFALVLKACIFALQRN